MRLRLRERALHLGGGRSIGGDALDLGRDRALELGERAARRGRGHDLEEAASSREFCEAATSVATRCS